MRPKILIGLIVVTVLVLSLAFLARRHKPDSSPENYSTASVVQPEGTNKVSSEETAFKPLVIAAKTASNPSATIGAVPTTELTDTERQTKIDEAITQINAALMQNDSNSVALILSNLTNAEKEVREQAVSAVKQLGDRDLIPALTNLAARTEDYEDRHALQAAADFIAQPTLAEAEKYWKENGTPLSASPVRRDGQSGSRHPQRRNQQPAAPADTVVPNQ